MSLSVETLAVARKYTDDSLAGAGAVAGVPCQIQSKTAITGGTRITFLWVDNNGDSHTTVMDVMNGIDGEDGKGIQSVSVNAENHLIITYSDGTTVDAGQIEIHSAVDSVNGQTGAVVLDAEDVGALPDDTPIPSKTSDLTNDSGFITKVVNDLVNYYLKSETYSKAEVDDIVTAIKNSRFEVVATLPTTDIKTNVIYLVPKSPSQTSNVKDEYINLDGTTAGWEKIGDTEIDLSDYVTTQALNTALAAYTTTADLTTLLAAKQDTLTFDNAPTENSNNPVKSNGLYVANQNIYEVMGQNGAKNLLPNIGVSNTINGITYTVNEDGSVTADGTATSNSEFLLIQHNSDIATEFKQNIIGKTLILSGCPDGGGSSKYHVRKWGQGSSGTYYDQGKGVTFTPTLEEYDSYTWNFQIRIMSGITVSNLLFKPMLRLASDTDDTYEPYAKTNQQLTAENQTLTNNVDVLFETGVKNICPPYSGSMSSNGITYIGNSDGTVTVNGTCSANAGANIRVYLKAGQYKVSGCPSGGSYSTYRIGVTTDSWTLIGTHDHGNGTTITIPSDDYYRINLDVRAGYVANNLVFKPMITDVDTPESDYDHYVPYAKTNQQLTEDSIDWDNFSELGAVNMLDFTHASEVRKGYTFTNTDGVVTVTGSRASGETGNADHYVNITLTKGTYKVSGCPSGGSDDTWRLLVNINDGAKYAFDYGDGAVFTLTEESSLRVYCTIMANYSDTVNLTFYPMITVPSYNGDYVPYAKSNKELTEKIDIVGNLFTTTTKVVDNITHGIATTVATLENLPIGTYVVSGQFNSDSAMSGGGLIQFASSGVIQNGASCSTMINQGFKANAGLTGIFNVTNATNRINLQIYTANADLTVVSAKLAAIRIA